MKILNVKSVSGGEEEEITLELTDEERNMIKKEKGWKRLTQKRLTEWFLETLKNTIEKEGD